MDRDDLIKQLSEIREALRNSLKKLKSLKKLDSTGSNMKLNRAISECEERLRGVERDLSQLTAAKPADLGASTGSEFIQKKFEEVLQKLLDEKFELPWHLVLLGSNGAIMGCRYELSDDQKSLDCIPLVEYTPGDVVRPPINIVITSNTGKAVRVLLTSTGEPVFFD
jgi:hypothetical protein